MTTEGVVELDVALGPQLTAKDAVAIYAQGQEAVVFALLELARRLAGAEGRCASVHSPATPSGMRPVHQKPAVKKRGKTPGRPAGHPGSRRPPPAHRRAKDAPRSVLSALSGRVEALPGNPHSVHRRHSPRYPTGGHRAHDPPGLVSALLQAGRAGRPRCLAGQSDWQPRADAVGLAGLWAGTNHRARRGRVQSSLAILSHARRAATTVVSLAGDFVSLVRADSKRGFGRGRVARRRNGLAREWKRTLAVVFQSCAWHVLPDRPAAWSAGVGQILSPGVCRHAGQRLFGARTTRWCAAGVKSAWHICCAI